jgi:hypothetical protein
MVLMANSHFFPYRLAGFGKAALAGLFLFQFSCTEPYAPPATQGNHKYLVVDGFINTGSDSTIFNLSNSTNLGDSLPPSGVTGAQIIIEGSGGYTFALTELGNGRYGASVLNVDPTQQYRVRVNTLDGNQYLSQFVPVLQTPPIDSISWRQQDQGVQIFVTTHDPQNLINYYEWQYGQAWEYHSNYNALIAYQNDSLIDIPPNEQIYSCWNSSTSTDIIVGSSANLSQRIIYEQPLVFIPQPSVELSVEYSILVKQFALTQNAYNYWENLKANTQDLGSLFDPQPGEVAGNIACINNPSLPVLGYVSAANVQEQRIFISNSQLVDWIYGVTCTDTVVSKLDFFAKYSKIGYVPINTVENAFLDIAFATCVNCTLAGPGTTMKPPFWP